MKYNLDLLQHSITEGFEPDYLLFWGHRRRKDGKIGISCLSQWWESSFKVDEITYKTAEHWMMAGKAKLFEDEEMLQKIIEAETPNEAKKFGRKVSNFDQKTWEENRYQIVKEGNLYKFEQNELLKTFLLNTGNKVLVEASPFDKIWGIGMGRENPNAVIPQNWNGLNLLGFALMEVRDILKEKL